MYDLIPIERIQQVVETLRGTNPMPPFLSDDPEERDKDIALYQSGWDSALRAIAQVFSPG